MPTSACETTKRSAELSNTSESLSHQESSLRTHSQGSERQDENDGGREEFCARVVVIANVVIPVPREEKSVPVEREGAKGRIRGPRSLTLLGSACAIR